MTCPGTVERYIARAWLGLFLATLLGALGTAILVDVSVRYEDLPQHTDLLSRAYEFYVAVLPLFLHALMPIVGFVATVVLAAVLASRNEWFALQVVGRSPARLFLPFGVIAVVLAGTTCLNRELFVPAAIDAYFSLRGKEKLTGGIAREAGRLCWFGRSSFSDRAIFDVVHIQHNGKNITSLGFAKRLSWRDGVATPHGASMQLRRANGLFQQEETQDWASVPPLPIAAEQLLPVPLGAFSGRPTAKDNRWWLLWHELWTVPLSVGVLQFLAGAFLLTGQGRSLLGRVVGSLLAGFAFCALTVWCRQLGLQGALPVSIAAWIPLLITTGLTLVLWRRRVRP